MHIAQLSQTTGYAILLFLNPFTTEPQASFLLIENDNLGIIN